MRHSFGAGGGIHDSGEALHVRFMLLAAVIDQQEMLDGEAVAGGRRYGNSPS